MVKPQKPVKLLFCFNSSATTCSLGAMELWDLGSTALTGGLVGLIRDPQSVDRIVSTSQLQTALPPQYSL